MKKILFTILTFFVLTISVNAQFPIGQTIGSPVTLLTNKGGFKSTVALIITSYQDTATANLDLYVDTYSGSMIWTTSDGKLWIRNTTATAWILVSGSSGSVNIYNSDGTLSGNRNLTGAGFNLGFQGLAKFGVGADSVTFTMNGGGQFLIKPTLSYFLGNVGIGTNSPVGKLSITTNGIQTQSDANGIYLANTANSTGLTVMQLAPPIVWQFSGWKQTPTTGSRQFRYRVDAYPVNFTSAVWRLGFSTDSTVGTYSPKMTVKNNGDMLLFADSAAGTYGTVNGIYMNALTTDQIRIGVAGRSVAIGGGLLSASFGSSSTMVGDAAGASQTTGTRNVGIGTSALNQATIPSYNTAIGHSSMISTVGGYSNTAVGANSLMANVGGFQNTTIGAGSMENSTSAQENTGVGYDAGLNATTAIRNVWLGWNAKSGTDGYQNEMIGYTAGASLTAGNHDNIGIGFQSMFNGSQKVDAANSIAIGSNSFTTLDNQVVLGNSSMTQNIFWGALMPNSLAGTSGQVLTSAGANTSPTWSTPSTVATAVPISGLTAATGTNIVSMGGFDFGLTGGNFGVGVSPSYRLDVLANASGVFAANIYNSNADGAGLGVKVNNSVVNRTAFSVGSGSSGSTLRFEVTADGKVKAPSLAAGNGTKAVRWDATAGLVLADTTVVGGGSGITVGTTIVTSGTNMALLYNATGVVGNGSTLLWDETNKFLGVGYVANIGIIGVNSIYGSGDANGDINIFGTSSGTTTSSNINLQTGGGNVTIGTATATAQFHTTGSVRFASFGAGAATFDASGNISSVSDERAKKDISSFRFGLRDLMKLHTITYRFNGLTNNETEHTYAGFSAQNVHSVLGDLGTGIDAKGLMTLQDRSILALLVNAVQEQQKEIDTLKKQLKKKR